MRIRYTHQEWAILRDAWPTEGHKALWTRWEEASLTLPPERRRQFHPSAGTVIKRLLGEAAAVKEALKKETAAKIAAGGVWTLIEACPERTEPPAEALVATPPPAPTSASDLFLDQLITRLVPALMEAIRPLFPAPVTMYERVLRDGPGAAAPKRQTSRILVAGVRGSQKYELKQALKERLPDTELVFWGVEEADSIIKARARGASHTIVWTKFISHAHEKVVREATDHWSRWPGGMDGLKEEVERAANLACADTTNGA